jgi:hypothetical protein
MNRILLTATAVLFPVVLGAPVQAATAVLVPVVVGSGEEPSAELMAALARGLREAGKWTVHAGDELRRMAETPVGLSDSQHAALAAKLAGVNKLIEQGAKDEAVAAADALRTEVAALMVTTPLGERDLTLAYRVQAARVAALRAAGNAERAKVVAEETQLLFPARKPSAEDGLAAPLAEALTTPGASTGVKLSLSSSPDGCDVRVNGTSVGRSPVEVNVLPGATYQAQAVCTEPNGTSVASFPKRIGISDKDTGRKELLDAGFEKSFRAAGASRVRFASSDERRQSEQVTARRLADRYAVDMVILASVGELSGADWLAGRLYLKNGYLNRQALARLEPARAEGLGRYLATGKETPGVLRPEEAGAMVAAAAQSEAPAPQARGPWYTDAVGWSLAGVGAVGVSLGMWANSLGDKKTKQGDAIRGDSELQQSYYREAQKKKFLGSIGLVGGGLTLVTGVVLLAIPEYADSSGEMIVLTPTTGGAQVGVRGRF